ncbi:MAG: glycosyltransferase family 4 protein [Lentisphaerae bacterium]|nr:glycosyltransferase family 4 protein [Lentisphaerota bacterium]
MASVERIAFVSPRFARDDAVGGAETLLKNLAERAASAGKKVVFLTTCAKDHFTWQNVVQPGWRRHGDLNVHFFPVDADRDVNSFLSVQDRISRRVPVTPAEEEIWMRHSVNSLALYDHLRSGEGEYDRVIAGPYLFGITFNASMICPEKTILVPCLHDEPFARLGIIRKMFRSVRGFMFNVGPEMDLAISLYDLPPEKCKVVGMGLDEFSVDGKAFRERYGITSPYVIYSGRREAMKGVPLLLDYMDAFRKRTGLDVKFVLTGSGTIDAPDTMKDHVIDLGVVSVNEMREAMAGAVALVHASMYESLGIVLIESFMAGTPALVFAKGRVLQWQCERSNGGLWFKNYPEFEESLKLLLENQSLRDKLAACGKEFVLTEYSWDAVEKRMMDSLREI